MPVDRSYLWLLAATLLGSGCLADQPIPGTDIHIDPGYVDLSFDSPLSSPGAVVLSVVNVGRGDAEVNDLVVFGDNAFRVVVSPESELPVLLSPNERLDLGIELAELPDQRDPFFEELELWVEASGEGGADGATAIIAVGMLERCDMDGDGHMSAICDGDDCDDENPVVNPSMTESCNGSDDDCDGRVDEEGSAGADMWFADADEDGFGRPGSGIASCEPPPGHVGNELDCDDTTLLVNPLADELCNGFDDDCDGDVDEGGLDGELFYADADMDGWGDVADLVIACAQPPGYVPSWTDCDDSRDAVYPGAPEVCDSLDNDCDGSVDEEVGSTWYVDVDRDGYGDPSSSMAACTRPVGYSPNDEDCDDTEPTTSPASPEICDSVDNDCDGSTDEGSIGPTWYADSDSDGYGYGGTTTRACSQPSGYAATAGDCDDGDAAVSPVATESCNGIDDDCDTLTDESGATGESTWYRDGDSDSYGDPSITALACDKPTNFVADATDCDDTRSYAYPGATELCNSVDDDCDGTVDDGATGTRTWYADTDGDTWGDPAVSTKVCTAPTGYVGNFLDCDDAEATVYPGAPEYCDGVDEDCDGTADDSALDALTYYRDWDEDGYGNASASVSSCDQPSGYVEDDSDCFDFDDTIYPGATESCDGTDENCDDVIDDGATCPCDVDWFGSSAYLICDSASTWANAQASCATYGYDLVTIGNAAEDAWVDTTIDTYASTVEWWIGASDRVIENRWSWIGGSSSYTNWAVGQPDNAGNEDCAELNATTGGTWNDEACTDSNYFVCEAS